MLDEPRNEDLDHHGPDPPGRALRAPVCLPRLREGADGVLDRGPVPGRSPGEGPQGLRLEGVPVPQPDRRRMAADLDGSETKRASARAVQLLLEPGHPAAVRVADLHPPTSAEAAADQAHDGNTRRAAQVRGLSRRRGEVAPSEGQPRSSKAEAERQRRQRHPRR